MNNHIKIELRIIFSSILFFLLFCYANANEIKSKILYAKYIQYPKVVYTKQQFSTTIETNILLPDNQPFSFSTHIQPSNDIEQLTQDITWYEIEPNKYQAKFKYKVKNQVFKLPTIDITITDENGTILDNTIVKKPNIIFRKIAIDKNRYSNIIANDLYINEVKVKQYTNNKLLCVISLTGIKSNLEEFHLNNYKTQGEQDLVTNDDKQILYYYVIIPSHTQNIIFNYYNSLNNEFVNVTIPIELKEDLVSTQTNLNPYDSDMLFYQKISLMIFIIIFIMIYYFKRKFILLLVAVILMTILINISLPNKTIILPPNTKVYILPTSHSTVFKIVQDNEKVEVLKTIGKYKKVLFSNNHIGWIKEQ